MSKTSQRKRVAYEEGFRDGSRSNGFRYARHPFMDDYRRGWNDGCASLIPKTLLQKFRDAFA